PRKVRQGRPRRADAAAAAGATPAAVVGAAVAAWAAAVAWAWDSAWGWVLAPMPPAGLAPCPMSTRRRAAERARAIGRAGPSAYIHPMTDTAPQIADFRSFLYRDGALDPDGARRITAEALGDCEDGELYLQYMAS